MKRIISIQDLSCIGKCSQGVALPVLSAMGIECAVLPTALLSAHTAFDGFVTRDLTDCIRPILAHWKTLGLRFDAIYTGYLASQAQIDLVEEIFDDFGRPGNLFFVDPVMADNGSYYSKLGDDMCLAFRRLCRRADVITPNVTEAALLTGLEYREGIHSMDYVNSLLEELGKLCGGVVSITGVKPDEQSVGVATLNVKTGEHCMITKPVRPGIFYGTGDIFASAFAALLVRGAQLEPATRAALDLVGDSINQTVLRGSPRRFGVDFETALPNYVNRVSELFR